MQWSGKVITRPQTPEAKERERDSWEEELSQILPVLKMFGQTATYSLLQRDLRPLCILMSWGQSPNIYLARVISLAGRPSLGCRRFCKDQTSASFDVHYFNRHGISSVLCIAPRSTELSILRKGEGQSSLRRTWQQLVWEEMLPSPRTAASCCSPLDSNCHN